MPKMKFGGFCSFAFLAVLTWFFCGSNEVNKKDVDAGSAKNEVVLGLNSDWLEKAWANQSSPYQVADFISKTGTGPKELDITDRFEVIKFVLNQLPKRSTVYPSERYFYFKFYCGHRLISGNLRFCDAQENEVHFGYFDEFDNAFMLAGTLNDTVGANVELIDNRVSLSFDGIEKTFVLDNSFQALKKPVLHTDEKIVSPILDESGYHLWLLYNEKARRLYYVLDESKPTEQFHSVKSGRIEFLVGLSSRFVFFNDRNRDRKILVGVSKANTQANNYFDGPFDQVPPDLDIKTTLEHVYPYVTKGGGIDQHGNFLDDEHTRVAISPYATYQSTSEMLRFGFLNVTPQSDKNALPFLDLVYETKMDFHKVLENSTAKSESNEK